MNDLKVFFYDDYELQVYQALPTNFELSDDTETVCCTTLGNTMERYERGAERRTLEMKLEKLSKVELDPTTMQKIARYNLEQENESLVKQIAIKQNQLLSLEKKLKNQTARISDLQETVKKFVSSNYETVSEMFDCEDNF